MPLSAASPGDVLARLHDGIASGDWSDLADLYAPDAVVDIVFASPEAEHVEGREALRKRFITVAGGTLRLRAVDTVVHETTDPEVIVAEYDYEVRAQPDAPVARVSNIQVLRVRDGLIVASRDYHDHVGLATALGTAG